MLAFLFGAFFLIAPADTTDQKKRCADLHREAYSINPSNETTSPEEWGWFIEKIREARTCYNKYHPDYFYHRGTYVDEVWALHRLGRNKDAVAVANAFFERFDPTADARLYGRMYSWRGYLLYLNGYLAEAMPDYVRALRYKTDFDPEVLPGLYIDIGVALKRIRDFDNAQRFFQIADSIVQATDEPSPFMRILRARSRHLLSNSIIEQTDFLGLPDSAAYEQAGRLAQESLALLRGEDADADVAEALILFSETRSFRGEIEAASRLLDQAEAIIRKGNHRSLPILLARKKGRLFMQQGNYQASQRAFDEALERAHTTPNIPPDMERRIYRDMGHLAEVQGDFARAADHYREAIRVTEMFRQSLRSTSWAAQAFADWQESHRSLVRVLLAQRRYEDAFAALEQTRARHLLDLRTQSMLRSEYSLEKRALFDSLTAVLVDIRNQLATDTLTSVHRTELITQEQQIIPERQALLALKDSLRIPPLDAVQRVLAEQDQVMLSYFVDETGISDRLFGRTPRPHVFILTPDTLTAVPLNVSIDSLQALLAQVSPLFEKPETLPEFDDRMFSLKALHQLYERLYAPAAPHIPEGARLIVIPDGPLFMLPFAMLVTEETGEYQYRDAPYLLKQHPIAIELATALLLQSPIAPPPPTYDVVAFGKSRFSDTELPSRLRSNPSEASGLINLPAVTDEINAIKARFGNVSTRLDAQATEASFFDLAASTKILHLASHTIMRPSMPLQNAIVLSKDPADDRYDGILYLHEIQRRNVPVEFVVLSGCGTAQGVFQRGEGMASLQYAFRAMGVQGSLATSWFVDDKTAVLLMDVFYRNMRKGLPKDVALQRAQIRYLSQAEGMLASPFLWAAPVLYGDTAPLDLETPLLTRVLWAGLILLLLFGLYLGYRLIRTHLATV